MKHLVKYRLLLHLCLLLVLCSILGCPKVPSVSFNPPDKRPVSSVTVADAGEAELLKQQLKLEILRLENNVVYYYDQPGLAERLRSIGYTVNQDVQLQTVYYKIVRLTPKDSATQLPTGQDRRPLVKVLRREQGDLIVNGSLAMLERLSESGWTVKPQPREVFPRLIEVKASSQDEVNFIAANISDVISVTEQKDRTFIVNGSAFDYQLEELDKRRIIYKLLEP